MSARTQAIALAAASAAASVLLTSCTARPSPDQSALSSDDVAERYAYSIENEALTPSYALVPEFDDPRDLYARALLARDCLRGVADIHVVVPQPSTSLDAFDNRTNQRNFNEEIAAQWGYVLPPDDESANQGASSAELQVTPEVEEAFADCGERANERLGLPPSRAVRAVLDAGWSALATSDSYAEAMDRWVSCMAPAGVIDLPRDPHEMPSASIVASAGEVADNRTAPTQREREVAVADARCRLESGFDATEFRVRAEAELSAIGADVEAFESARRQYETYGRRVDEVIEEFG